MLSGELCQKKAFVSVFIYYWFVLMVFFCIIVTFSCFSSLLYTTSVCLSVGIKIAEIENGI